MPRRKALAPPKHLVHNRGYLGSILEPGVVLVGDSLKVERTKLEAIPYLPIERVKWYLDSQSDPVSAKQLVQSIALRTTYCRVLPRYLKKLGPRYQRLVVFANAEKRANKKSCQEPNW